MDINKEREAFEELKKFEAWWFENYDRDDFEDVVFSEILNEYESNHIFTDDLNKAWQAAKASVVPEGFVLVPSGVLDLTRFMCETWAEIDKFVYKNCQNLELYPLIQGSKTQSAIRKIGNQKFNPFAVGVGIQAMIEAQEPSND